MKKAVDNELGRPGPPGPSERTGQSDGAILHGKLGLPCVPIGSEFQHAGGTFVRTGELSALFACGRVFVGKGFTGVPIRQHAEACLALSRGRSSS